MSPIQPQHPSLLTERDVDYDAFHCCGNEELVFLRCTACTHLFVLCYECDTVYTDLTQRARQEGRAPTRIEDRFSCPACRTPFEQYFLMRPHVERYLATAAQVIAAGAGHVLSPELRARFGIAPT